MKCSRCQQEILDDEEWEVDVSVHKVYHLVCPVRASKARPEGFASTGGSAPSPAAKHGESCPPEVASHGETPVVNLVCSAPVERSAAMFPDIGPDPLKNWGTVRNDVIGARERLSKAVGLQQDGVPDQTMLAWRIDVSRVLDELTLMTARWRINQQQKAADSAPGVGQKATSPLKGQKGKRATARNATR